MEHEDFTILLNELLEDWRCYYSTPLRGDKALLQDKIQFFERAKQARSPESMIQYLTILESDYDQLIFTLNAIGDGYDRMTRFHYDAKYESLQETTLDFQLAKIRMAIFIISEEL